MSDVYNWNDATLNSEKKLHINLSQHAMSILSNDMAAFQIKEKSTFINRIIENFRLDANASLSQSSDKHRDRLSSESSSVDIDPCNQEKNKSYPKGSGFKIRLNNDNVEYLFSNECNEKDYYRTPGAYIKALIEEYCEKPYVEREHIYAKDFFSTIQNELDSEDKKRKMLSLRFKSGKTVKVKPYKIETDPLSIYHYLIGYEIDSDSSENKQRSFSCRITSLEEIRCLKQHAFISKDGQKKLDAELQSKGAQFMCEDINEHKIYLSDNGIELYNRMLHLRPQYKHISDDGHTYTFNCSQRQIEYYFFKFGEDAIILSPLSLKEKFLKMYQQAVDNYTNFTK